MCARDDTATDRVYTARDASVADLAAALHDDDPAVRERAGDELRDRYRLYDDSVVIEGLVAAARADGPTATGVVTLLTELRDDRAVPGLLALAVDPIPETRAKAATALGSVPGDAVDAALADLVDDPKPGVRAKALRAIQWRGHRRPPDVFLDALTDDDHRVVEAGISGCRRYGDRQRVRDALESLANDTSRSPSIRNIAARAHPDLTPDASRVPVVGSIIRRWLTQG